MKHWETISDMERSLLEKIFNRAEVVARRPGSEDRSVGHEAGEEFSEVWRTVTSEIVKLEKEKRELRSALQSVASDPVLVEDINHRIKDHDRRLFFCEQRLDRMLPAYR